MKYRRRFTKATVLILCCTLLASCGNNTGSSSSGQAVEANVNSVVQEDTETKEAVYLGIENYGSDDNTIENVDDFRYRFEIDGKEYTYKIGKGGKNSEGRYTYPVQNVLKEGSTFKIQVNDGEVVSAVLQDSESTGFRPVITATAGKKTLKNFIATAFMPMGTTLYVFSGGWNWQDNGADFNATSIGVSDDWVRFFQSQNENYTYRDKDGDSTKKDARTSYFPYGGYNEYHYGGLDCSGYVGWVVYNVMNTTSGNEGFVMPASDMAKNFADRGFGKITRNFKKPVNAEISDFRPGDIFSIGGHIWISLGTCDDGSILIIHSTPAPSRKGQPGGGVELSALGESKNCKAYLLADKYMSEYYPDWYSRYEVALKDYNIYTDIKDNEDLGKFSWDLTGKNGGMTDPEQYINKSPEMILADLFGE